jgi:hypothetical protein
MTDRITLDTSITEPGATAGEQEMLLFSLDRARSQFAWKVGGWTPRRCTGASRRRR